MPIDGIQTNLLNLYCIIDPENGIVEGIAI